MGQAILKPSTAVPFTQKQLPVINFKHILELTDLTGIIQHSILSIPDSKEGYSIDDNSHALLWALWTSKESSNKTAASLLPVYLSFIQRMQLADGHFSNFMSDQKKILDKHSSEESFGRTIMVMGFLINEGPTHFAIRTGMEIFSKAYPHVNSLTSLHGIATSIIGISQYIKYHYPDDKKSEMVVHLADKLMNHYEENKKSGWHWFGKTLTCNNALLPLALLNAYEISQEEKYLLVAMESIEFLESKIFFNGMLRQPDHEDGHKKGKAGRLNHQGIDVMAMVLCYQQAYRITREQQYVTSMHKCYQWFLGNNDPGFSLYDDTTGGCADGLQQEGIEGNQGAESTLAHWISHTVLTSALKD